MEVVIESSWKELLAQEFDKPNFEKLVTFVKDQYRTQKCYPPAKLIFNAFDHCSFSNLKVVIIGQDPYHGHGQANGLCFSVNDGITKPPSLINIFKEIHADLGIPVPASGNLTRWADQGVLLLNATLTVKASTPGSHQNQGWEIFTDAVIKRISDNKEHLVFLLWGAYAQRKGEVIDRTKHLVLASAHPSPFAAHRGFFGNRHFSKTNQYLQEHGIKGIEW
ncbi:MAG: uracil-DNA glycosylase [Cyclobacteriaceae bacterium]